MNRKDEQGNWLIQNDEQGNFIRAVERAYAAMHRLRDVTQADEWDRDLETAVADFALAAASVRNRFEELA